MSRWNITSRKDLAIIFFVFSITGSSSVFVGRPILKFLGLTLDNVPEILYYQMFIMSSFIFYQIFLVMFGWLFGQFQFFLEYGKEAFKTFWNNSLTILFYI